MASVIDVVERGRRITFSFEDLMRYHGPGSPGGVAHAFKVLERALPLLAPGDCCERREITVETAFGGPGARDAIEMVTRAVTGDRFHIDPTLARPERGRALERFVFRLGYRDRTTTLSLREGFVTDAFIDLARAEDRTADEERKLDELKQEMADRVMARPASEVYDATDPRTGDPASPLARQGQGRPRPTHAPKPKPVYHPKSRPSSRGGEPTPEESPDIAGQGGR